MTTHEPGSDRKSMDENRWLRALVENSSDGISLVNPNGKVEYVFPSIERILGYSPEELIEADAFAYTHPDEADEVRRGFAKLLREPGASAIFNSRQRHKDGSWRWVETRLTNLCEDPAVGGVVISFRDITERKRTEQNLLDQQSHWQMALRCIGDAVIATDATGVVTFLNPVAEVLCGVPLEQAVGRPHREIYHIVDERTRQSIESPVEQVLATADVAAHGKNTLLLAVGDRQTPIDDTAAPVFGEGGHLAGVILVFRDVTERRRIQELNERLAAIVESADDIIASKDLDGVITSWNNGAERTLGYAAAEVIGRHVSMIMPADLVEDMPRILERIRRGEKVDHYQTRRRKKDGTIIDVSLTVSPIRDASGQIVGASKIGRDVTAEKRAREERERLLKDAQIARSDAEVANRMKDEFLAILSHELRSPLNAIVGWATILSTGTVDPRDVHEGLAAIDRNAKAQVQIVDDLLDVSRIVSGNLRLDVQRVNLVEVIEAATTAMMPTAVAKGVRLRTVLDPLASPVSGDSGRLRQVVSNLLSNAVKFTPKGGEVQVLLERVNSHVEISVSDTGVGIRADFLPHVFDRFRQADSSSTRRHGGLGLGLAIVKQLTELQGGSARAKSAGEGQGSTFAVSFPIAAVREERVASDRDGSAASPSRELDRSDKSLSGIKALVVDDEPDARELIRHLLKDCDAEVAVAASAQEAMSLVESFRPDILVSDIGMPDQDGFDLIRQVRSRLAAKSLPAVALTAFARAEDRRRVLLAGFQTHMAKPVDPAELTAVVASLVERTGRST